MSHPPFRFTMHRALAQVALAQVSFYISELHIVRGFLSKNGCGPITSGW